MLTILRSLASAYVTLPMHRRLFSAKEREESSQIPNHLGVSFAKRTVWLPTWIALLLCQCFRFLESRIASVLEVSKQTALSLAHLRMAAVQSSSFWAASSRSTPSTTLVACLFVCYLVFLSRYMGPEGPW